MGTATISAPEHVLADIKEKHWSPSAIFMSGYELMKNGVNSANYDKAISDLQKRVEFFAGRLVDVQKKLYDFEEKWKDMSVYSAKKKDP